MLGTSKFNDFQWDIPVRPTARRFLAEKSWALTPHRLEVDLPFPDVQGMGSEAISAVSHGPSLGRDLWQAVTVTK
jgi:hypothetical protein